MLSTAWIGSRLPRTRNSLAGRRAFSCSGSDRPESTSVDRSYEACCLPIRPRLSPHYTLRPFALTLAVRAWYFP
jgi:hypothetical protein